MILSDALFSAIERSGCVQGSLMDLLPRKVSSICWDLKIRGMEGFVMEFVLHFQSSTMALRR